MELPRYRSQTLPQVAAESPFSAAAGASASSRALASGFDVLSDVTNRIATAEAEATAASALTDIQVKAREFVSNEKWKRPEIDGRPTDEVLKEEWEAFSQSPEPPRIGNRNAQNQYDNARKRILSDASLTVDSLRDRILIDRTRANEDKTADNFVTIGNYNAGAQVIRNSIAFSEEQKLQRIQRLASISTDTFIREDPYKAREELNKTDGSEQPFINDLDPYARNVAINRAESEIAQIEAQKRAEEAARQAQINSLAGYATNYLADAKTSLGLGIRPAPEGMAQVGGIISAMEEGPRKQQMMEEYNALNWVQSSGFLALPPDKQQQYVANQIAEAQKGNVSTANVARIKLMNDIAEQSARAAKEDPAGFGERQGIVQPPSGENLIEVLAAAATNAETLSTYFRAPVSGLNTQQITQLQRSYDKADVDGRLALLGTIVETHGQTKAVDLLQQVSKTSGPDMAAAGVLALDAPLVSRTVLIGQNLRKDGGDSIKQYLPPSIDFVPEIGALLGNAYIDNPANREIVESAIKDYYLAKSASSGSQGWNPALLREAAQAVTGGIVEFNGVKMPVPKRGITQADFDGFADSLSAEDFKGVAGFEPEYALDAFRRDGRLIQKHQGMFEVQVPNGSGDGYVSLKDEKGKALLIPWRESEPLNLGGWSTDEDDKFDGMSGFRY